MIHRIVHCPHSLSNGTGPMKRFFACCALLVGIAGLLSCIVVAVLVWPVTNNLTTEGEAVAAEADQVLSAVDERVTVWDKSLVRADERLRRITEDCRKLRGDRKAAPDDQQRLAELQTRLTALVEWLTTSIDGIDSGAKMLRGVAQMLKSLAALQGGGDDDTKRRIKTVETLAESLEKASKVLKTSLTRLSADGKAIDLKTTATLLMSVVEPIEGAVAGVQQRVVVVEKIVHVARADVSEIRRLLEAISQFGPPLITVVALWMALGQWCLAGWGWRRLRRRDAIPTT